MDMDKKGCWQRCAGHRPGEIPQSFNPPGRCPALPFDPWLSVFIRGKKQKTPPPVGQWGLIKLVNESEPDRRAAQPQRVQQQIQIQMAIHGHKITTPPRRVKLIFTLASLPPPPGH
jgi:hypothetical protein